MVRGLVRRQLLRCLAARRPARTGDRRQAFLARRLVAPPDQGQPLRRPLRHPAQDALQRLRLPSCRRGEGPMTLRPSRRAAVAASIVGFLLHTVTAILVWRTWGAFGRGNVIAWIDF